MATITHGLRSTGNTGEQPPLYYGKVNDPAGGAHPGWLTILTIPIPAATGARIEVEAFARASNEVQSTLWKICMVNRHAADAPVRANTDVQAEVVLAGTWDLNVVDNNVILFFFPDAVRQAAGDSFDITATARVLFAP
ncbi:hypothetical protein [Zavarzinia sp.]|jgi:hypothetical protein|uniref:hypothetical protein n=1 Tax=Zavarzinia sp. TaxID=2027920 RepID=UPI00356A5EB4